MTHNIIKVHIEKSSSPIGNGVKEIEIMTFSQKREGGWGRGGSGRGDCSGCEFKSVIGFYSYYGQVRLGHLFILALLG